MKKIFFLFIVVISFASCDFITDVKNTQTNTDSLRADSLWKVAIADSINRARGIKNETPQVVVADTPTNDVEKITRGMNESLNKVQESLNKIKKVTEVSANSAKTITDGINKTKEAVNKTVEEARKTIDGDKPKQ